MTFCIALASCAGAGVAAVAALLVCPPLLVVFDIAFSAARDDPPFRWLKPMVWLLPACAVAGGCAGAILAWVRLRAGDLRNEPQAPPSREHRDRGS
jgi:hypothetical protein